ncbi:class I SAM-dependent methyltransferase [Maribacter sp. PR1]|uniref:Class I SAM-dependent methyltransferase n=1 Tax=Maribacter cobaltidurans TaxID=1178778 RepID=A0ABU7IQK0_9FLAO|nr:MULTISPECIES: class I SAM-dependent methyltransferase [Maribacter]MDC6387841.1 class I SAM-dependent methyltransferase [Maribacter sp. PR1]MEE1975230.1 class I SAM-dependent methyltransferase [Maribacter cobaltidurans]
MKVYLQTKDYFHTQETFELLYDSELDMLVTHPKPENLNNYYDSKSYISHTDRKETLIDKIYQLIKKYSLKKKYKLIDTFKTEEKTILDIGAGTGDFLKKGIEENWNISGVEPNAIARDIAKEKGIDLEKDLEHLPEQKYDVITLWHVLEHLPNLENQIKKIITKLKPNGYLFVAVPNYKSYDAQKYKHHWAAYDTPRHLWHFSQNSISKLFNNYKLKVVNTKPMYFDSFYVSLLSEKYKTGRPNYFRAFWNGLISNIKAIRTKEYSSIIYILKKEN